MFGCTVVIVVRVLIANKGVINLLFTLGFVNFFAVSILRSPPIPALVTYLLLCCIKVGVIAIIATLHVVLTRHLPFLSSPGGNINHVVHIHLVVVLHIPLVVHVHFCAAMVDVGHRVGHHIIIVHLLHLHVRVVHQVHVIHV